MSKRKKILITGATSGIGFMLAQQLQKDGHQVYATGRNTNALAQLEKQGVHIIVADLSKEASYEDLFRNIDIPDTVILNAGVGTFAYLTDLKEEQIDQMLSVNVKAPIMLTNYFAKLMKERNSGHFIFVASQAGKVATPKASAYAATKHATIGFANAARMELKEYGIQVSTINPGPIDTPFLDLADQTGGYREKMSKHLLSPQHVVDAIKKVIDKPVREVDLPFYMSFTSKLYAVFPKTVELLGKSFFNKK
ncbi:MAG: SDR family NAD(P)-dependent oxidoreductase [Psychrobacillus psychrodurans]